MIGRGIRSFWGVCNALFLSLGIGLIVIYMVRTY